MVGRDGRVKILDFGLARRLASSAQHPDATTSSIDVSGAGLAGTVGYIAPEQILGQPADERSDIFSLGVVLFEMFAQRRPFQEPDALGYALSVTTRDAPSAVSVNGSISAPVSAVIGRALDRDPHRRYPSARALAADMTAAMASSPTVTVITTPTPPPPAARQRIAHVVVLGALAVVVGATVATLGRPVARLPAAGIASSPPVLAIIPATPLDTDETVRAIAAGLTSTVAANVAAVSAINVVPGVAAVPSVGGSPNIDAIMQRVGATWALGMTVRQQSAGYLLHASILKSGDDAPAWEAEIPGTAATVTQRLLGELATALPSTGIVSTIAGSERRRLLAAPTTDSAAFIDYSNGRMRLAGVVNNDVFEAASQDFQRAIDRDPNFALAFAGLAEARWRAYNQVRNPVTIDQAIEAAHRATALDPTQAAAQLSLANVLNLTGRSAEALAAVDRAIELLPSNDDAYRLRGRLLLQAGKMDEGFASLERAITLRPTYFANHEMRGFWLYRAGRLEEAAAAFKLVTELAPDFANGYHMLGTTLHRLGRAEEAIGYYEHSVRLGPSGPAYSNLAYSYYETGRYRDALAAYQEALKLDPRSPGRHRNMGDVYVKLGRQAEARRAYESAIAAGEELLKINRADATTISLVALSEAKLGRTLAAERHAAEALVLAPKDMEVAVKNAEVYAILRQPSRAVRALKSALSLGYDPATASKNEELRSIHGTPEFEELLATSKK
jgi:serine/threonine-protein kinase